MSPSISPLSSPVCGISDFKRQVESRIGEVIASQNQNARLQDALDFATQPGGKLIRPQLVYDFYHVAMSSERGSTQTSIPAVVDCAVALELIHTYSLVHDDLPAMDNALLRRGRPTCWAAHGEATAILVGDALIPLAYEILCDMPNLSDSQKITLMRLVSKTIGANGLVAGQMMDLFPDIPDREYEGKGCSLAEVPDREDGLDVKTLAEVPDREDGRGGTLENIPDREYGLDGNSLVEVPDREDGRVGKMLAEVPDREYLSGTIELMQILKTGVLLGAACGAGVILGGREDLCKEAIYYGERLGLLYQLTDDLLDKTGTPAVVGKTVNNDQDKITFLSVFGEEKVQEMIADLTQELMTLNAQNFSKSPQINDLISQIVNRVK